MVRALLLALLGAPAVAAAAAPVLPEPSALAGDWRLSDGSGLLLCWVILDAAPAPGGWRQRSDGCLERFIPGVGAWRPASDGLAFAAPDRRTLAFFARTAPGRYVYVRPDGARLELVREDQPPGRR